MNRFMMLLPLGFLVGCYNEEAFNEDVAAAYCDKATECEGDWVDTLVGQGLEELAAQTSFDTFSDAACSTDDSEDDSESDCDFDATTAEDCVTAVENMDCDDLIAGNTPAICDDVCG